MIKHHRQQVSSLAQDHTVSLLAERFELINAVNATVVREATWDDFLAAECDGMAIMCHCSGCQS